MNFEYWPELPVGVTSPRTHRLPLFAVLFLPLSMKGKTKERWQEVCEQAAVEKDPEKLLKLVAEINQLLHEKLGRLEDKAPAIPIPRTTFKL